MGGHYPAEMNATPARASATPSAWVAAGRSRSTAADKKTVTTGKRELTTDTMLKSPTVVARAKHRLARASTVPKAAMPDR